jgi:hypothetical protein
MADDKSYIIDPLTTLCKLAILYFLPDNTKLSISNHVLHIQEYTYLQGAKRMMNGDNRKDISNLNTPIIKVIKWYILDNEEKIEFTDDKINLNIKTIALYAIKGLKKIQMNTYNSDLSIKIILQYFINILTDSLENKWDETHIVKNLSEGSVISEKIKNNYDAQIISTATQILTESEKSSTKDSTIMINCLHDLLGVRDSNFISLMKELNTTL